MQRRAELEEQTRRRITESAVALHEELGPALTSISAIAEHAGVRRSTVYRHFPDEAALFAACSAHWVAINPRPDIGAWAAIADPGERVRTALPELYAYYRSAEQMLANLHRDEELVPAVKKQFAGYHEFVRIMQEILVAGHGVRGRARTRLLAAAGHAVTFTTWQSLARDQGLDDERAADLMARLVTAASA